MPKEEIFPAISQAFPGPYLMIGDRTTDRRVAQTHGFGFVAAPMATARRRNSPGQTPCVPQPARFLRPSSGLAPIKNRAEPGSARFSALSTIFLAKLHAKFTLVCYTLARRDCDETHPDHRRRPGHSGASARVFTGRRLQNHAGLRRRGRLWTGFTAARSTWCCWTSCCQKLTASACASSSAVPPASPSSC